MYFNDVVTVNHLVAGKTVWKKIGGLKAKREKEQLANGFLIQNRGTPINPPPHTLFIIIIFFFYILHEREVKKELNILLNAYVDRFQCVIYIYTKVKKVSIAFVVYIFPCLGNNYISPSNRSICSHCYLPSLSLIFYIFRRQDKGGWNAGKCQSGGLIHTSQ